MKFSNFFYILILLLLQAAAWSQCLTGSSGYFSIPSGEIGKDRSFFAGVHMLNKEYSQLWETNRDIQAMFATVTFLPFMEVSLRFSRPYRLYSTTGDRMAILRFKVCAEGKYRPAIVLGLQGFLSTISGSDGPSYFNSTYLVATKNIKVHKIIETLGLNLGYGSDVIKAHTHQFIGVFGGIRLVPEHVKWMELFVEYDADKTNAGMRVTVLKHFVILGGFEGLKAPSAGVSYKMML